jgi:beta-glucosidase
MEMVGEGYLDTLEKSLKQGRISQKHIDDACRRILEAKYKLGLFKDPYRGISAHRQATEMLTAENRAAARDMAARSCVLLKNEKGALPLKREGTIALIGPLADDKDNLIGTWAISADTSKCVPVLEGVKKAAGGATVLYARGANITDDPEEAKKLNALGHCAAIDPRAPEDMIAEAVAAARKADRIVAVVGESRGHSGEASSRADITIPAAQKPLLKELAKVAKETGKPLILVLMSGRPLALEWEHGNADAMLMAWHGGTEAGNAIADVLFGDHNPSGRLTATFPRKVGHVPSYYTQKSGGRPYQRAFHKHTTCYLDGEHTPLYPFGYGLSYSRFDYGPVRVSKTKLKGEETLKASVRVTNSGPYAGGETVQLYITDPVCSRTRPVKELKGFRLVDLAPGQSADVTFEITPEDLKFFITPKKFGWEPGEFRIEIGRNCEDTQSATVHWARGAKPQPGAAPKR